MRIKHLLLGSVSIAAVGSSAAVFQAQAQEVQIPPGFQYSLEGAWLMGKNNVTRDKLGSGADAFDIQDNQGVRGALSAGVRIDENWSLQFGASANQMLDSHATASSGGTSVDFVSNFSFQNLDFSAAYSPVLSDNFNVQLFGGIRGLHYTDSQDKLGSSGGFELNGRYKAEFIGVGPRIGVSGSAKFGDSPFGISGMLAAAAALGEERTNTTVESSGGPGPSGSESGSKWKSVYDVEAALGLDFYATEQTKFTLGMRAEQISGVSSGSSIAGFSGGATTRLVYGPFAKLSGSF